MKTLLIKIQVPDWPENRSVGITDVRDLLEDLDVEVVDIYRCLCGKPNGVHTSGCPIREL